ncbi:hypothetical protein [Streptomyces chartreusis]|uniref:hypothetical protein n=1 Tax=Streptomyces chartreusis TaxID=1969 RepID=UPI0033B26DC0
MDSLAAQDGSNAASLLLPDFDGVRGAGERPSVGAFANVLHDDVVDEVVLELVVGELAGEPEFLDLVPVAAASVNPQGRGLSCAALAFIVARLDDAADLELAVPDVVGDRVGGDDGGVLVGGVDDVAVAAADVVFGVGQPVDEGLGRDVEAGVLQGLVAAVGRGEMAELGVPVLGGVRRQAVPGGDLGAQEVVEGSAQGASAAGGASHQSSPLGMISPGWMNFAFTSPKPVPIRYVAGGVPSGVQKAAASTLNSPMSLLPSSTALKATDQ